MWVSSNGGDTWDLVSGTSRPLTGPVVNSTNTVRTFTDGARSADCSDNDGGLYLIGGSSRSPTYHWSNVSYSSDVVNWDNWGSQSFWRRQRSTCAVNRNRQLFVLGGLTHVNNAATASASNDVWMSTGTGGRGGWSLVTLRSNWRTRQGPNSDFYYSSYLNTEVLYVMNGYVGAQRWNDIWVSVNNGQSFARLNAAAQYAGRMDAQLTVNSQGVMIISAGDCGDTCNKNDVWASLDGGYTWGNCCDGAMCGFTVREDHVQALDSQGRLVIFSGSQSPLIIPSATCSLHSTPRHMFPPLHSTPLLTSTHPSPLLSSP